jgi:hypothetical protein
MERDDQENRREALRAALIIQSNGLLLGEVINIMEVFAEYLQTGKSPVVEKTDN